MKKFEGRFLVKADSRISNVDYKIINSVWDYKKNCRCIVVKNLNPDYYLLFGSIELIVTENGSVLSHLAIVGRDHNLPILLVEDIISQIPLSGRLSVKESVLEIETV